MSRLRRGLRKSGWRGHESVRCGRGNDCQPVGARHRRGLRSGRLAAAAHAGAERRIRFRVISENSRRHRSAAAPALSGAGRRAAGLPLLRFDRRAHSHLHSRLVLSRRRLSRARLVSEQPGRGEGGPAQSARTLHVGPAARRCRLYRPIGGRPRRPDRLSARRAPQRPDHLGRPFERRRARDPLRRRRASRGRGVELSPPRPVHSARAFGARRRCGRLGQSEFQAPVRPAGAQRHRHSRLQRAAADRVQQAGAVLGRNRDAVLFIPA